MYKKSIYNILVEDTFLWNTLTGAMLRLDADGLALYKEKCDWGTSSYFPMLKSNGFLVEENLDEFQMLLKREAQLQCEPYPEDLFFVIAPTLRCNYSCSYCFEHDRDIQADMSKDVQKQLQEYLRKRISENRNLKRLHVTWFGGEPLLRLDIIDGLSAWLSGICQKHEVVYRPAIITNGRFLNRDAMDMIVRDNFQKIQISIDGTCQAYCTQKSATEADYAAVIENIVQAAGRSSCVLLRINVEEQNFQEAYKLTRYLLDTRGLDGRLKLYLAFVNKDNTPNKTLDYANFVEQERQFQQMFGAQYARGSYAFKRPLAKGISCRLACDSNVCIGPKGELYKCEHHFGQTKWIVGNIQEGSIHKEKALYQRFQRTTAELKKCRTCDIFPICMSGCMNHRIMQVCLSTKKLSKRARKS